MSEDSTPQVEQPAIVDTPENDEFIGDITTPAAAEGNGGKKGNAKKGNKKQEQKEQVPIEELYDLSKPIKRVSSVSFIVAIYFIYTSCAPNFNIQYPMFPVLLLLFMLNVISPIAHQRRNMMLQFRPLTLPLTTSVPNVAIYNQR